MKKIIFLFLFGWGFGFGQTHLVGNANYFLETDMSLGQGYYGGPCGYGGLVWFHVTKAQGQQIFYKDNPGTYQNTWDQMNRTFDKISFNESNLMNSFSILSTKRSPDFGSCETDSEVQVNGKPIYRFDYRSYVNAPNNGGVLAYGFNGTINMRTYPVVNLSNTVLADDLAGYDDFINIPPISGVLSQYFNWQYSTVADNSSSSWISLPPQFQGLNSLNIKTSDFLPANLIGSTFYLRVKTNDWGAGRLGTPVKLRCTISAPHILPTPPPAPTTCFETNDGKIRVKLDRNLLPNEGLGYQLLDVSTSSPTVVKSLEFDLNNLLLLDEDNSFELTGLAAGTYLLKLGIGGLNGLITYTGGINHSRTYTINKPEKLTFTKTTTNVNCNGGSDGTITITSSGGTLGGVATDGIDYQFSRNGGATWQPFSNGNIHTITGLLNGNYTIQVKDANNCVAKDVNQNVITEAISITTVPQAVQLVNAVFLKQPTFNGATNGQIKATVKGGTRKSNDNQAYNYVWKKKVAGVYTALAGGVRTTQYNDLPTAQENNNLEITLDNVPAGEYALTVTDKNYATAIANNANVINSVGCSIIDLPIELLEPAKIEVTFAKTNPRCNAENQFGNETDNIPPFNSTGVTRFRDEAQDGKIIATVTGGVQFSGLGIKPYKYFWQKKIAGVWTNITNENYVLENIGDGEYSFNVEDKNGYRLGTFDNVANIQSAVIDVPNLIVQPAKLNLALTKTDVNCGGANTGSATANPQGGVAPYTYQWNDNDNSTTQTVFGLSARNYFVVIKDSKGCIVQGNIDLPQPSDITISNISKSPDCFDGNNGKIDLVISGGNPPFKYFWNGNVELDQPNFLDNLSEGSYSVIIKDSKGCEFSESATLINPAKITVDLGANRTLCNGQKHDLDITITDTNPTYTWTSNNGFTSNLAQVSLTQAGIYKAKVVTSLGCIATDEIEIKTNQVNIESEFFVTSQAYVGEDVILVNTSNPFGQNTQWVYPADAIVVSQEPKFTVLKFDTAGNKAVSLKQTQGDCFALYSKNINVEDRGNIPNSSNNNSPFIKDFLVTPVPIESNGNFKVFINLQEISPIKLRLYSLAGQNAIIQKSEAGAKNYVVDFNLSITTGTYVLVLETAKQTLIRKIIKE